MASREDNNSAREDKHPKGDLEVAYIIDDGGDGRFDWGVDDLERGVKQVMGDFLNCITVEARNTFPVSAGSTEVSYQDNGYPAEFSTAGNSHQQSTFTSSEGLNNWDTDYLDSRSDVKMADYLSKGKTKNTTNSTGHNLLSKIKSGEGLTNYGKASVNDDGQGPVPKQVSQVLRSNRFSPTRGSTPFVAENQIPNSPGRIRDALGAFDTGEEITFDDIAKIGLSLMVKATGHDNDGDKDPTSGAVTAEQLLPSLLQTAAVKIEANQLNARTAFPLSTVDRIALESDLTLDYSQDESKSYGVLNSHVEPFDGFLPLGMTALSAALVPALLLSTEAVFSTLSLIVKFDGDSVPNSPGPYILGEYGRPEPSGILNTLIGPKQLGIFMTEHSFVEAVDAGTNVFFGFEGENIANAVGSSLLNVIQSPGYYAVVVRSILRSANTILNEISDAFSSGSFVESLQAVVGLVDVLKSSKVFAYFNMLAQLGDLELTKIDNGIIEKVGQKKNASAIDEIDDVAPSNVFGMVQKPRASVMKSRIKSSDPDRAGSMDLRLSWRASSSPALYILPETFLRAGTDFGGNAKPKTILSSDLINKTIVTQAQKRLDSSKVEALEDAMEAEYVPFYFHDLRTNEIVSFHAFLASLSDSFTSNYEPVAGYGRIEPVRIYRSTERSISFSFHVVATSEADFDEMWWKINKIVTLLYPQWSPGRQLENTATGGSFRQPFSQIPTSSPLIRLRIGDVIKSNYSKFNLSRLFGLGSGDESFKIDGYLEGIVSPKLVEKIRKQALEIRRLRSKEFVQGDELNLRPSSRKGYEPAPAVGVQVLGPVKVTEQTKVLVLKETSSTVKDKKKGDIDVKAFIVKRSDGKPFTDRQGEKVKEIIVTAESLDASPEALTVSDDLADLIVQDQGSIEAVQEFFNSEQNPIVRAFDSAKGRGLAGVITSMNFDWYTPTWETEIVGSKAPQYCLVEIGFSPIHDILPGIDSDGFNRAPVYPVGRIVNSVFGDIRDDKDRETLEEEANLNRAKGIF